MRSASCAGALPLTFEPPSSPSSSRPPCGGKRGPLPHPRASVHGGYRRQRVRGCASAPHRQEPAAAGCVRIGSRQRCTGSCRRLWADCRCEPRVMWPQTRGVAGVRVRGGPWPHKLTQLSLVRLGGARGRDCAAAAAPAPPPRARVGACRACAELAHAALRSAPLFAAFPRRLLRPSPRASPRASAVSPAA